MKAAVPPVPSYLLSPLARAGVLVRPLALPALSDEHPHRTAHRDAHYLLVLLQAGELQLTLDFEDLTLSGPTLVLISPGQVHRLRGAVAPQGWGVSFEPGLVEEQARDVLEQGLRQPLPLAQQPRFTELAAPLLALLADCQAEVANVHMGPTLQALLSALLHLVAGLLAPMATSSGSSISRAEILLDGFRRLLRQHFTTWKQPAQYAAALAVTPSHLNDTVKALSGCSVSTHLQQRTILEAKRLLYYSDQSVKQIGYALGYDEPVYFGKLFKKHTGLTPQQFRRAIRE